MADPMYRQIADDLRGKIESGEWDAGFQLPTELELREQYGAARNTVRDAIKLLIVNQLVETRPGRGTFVTERITPYVSTLSADPRSGFAGGEGTTYLSEARARRREPAMTVPRVEIQGASELAVRELRIAPDSQVVSRHQQLRIDGKPYSMQTSFYPMRFVTAGATRLVEATDIEEGVATYLKSVLGLSQVGYQDRITARPPNSGEIAFFRFPDNSSVLILETIRTAYDAEGEPFRVTVTVWPADRNHLVYNIGQLPDYITDPAASVDG